MSQPAKAQEPSMEEILASIRRIIADDDASKQPVKPATKAPEPPPPVKAAPPPPPPPSPEPMGQDDIDAMLAGMEAKEAEAESAEDVFELTEAMAAPEPQTPSFRRIEANQDVVFEEPPPPRPSR